MKRAKPTPPDDPRPRTFPVENWDRDYPALKDRDLAGEIVIWRWDIGPTPSQYLVHVYYPHAYSPQQTLPL